MININIYRGLKGWQFRQLRIAINKLQEVVKVAKQDVLDAIAKTKADFQTELAEAQARITEDFDELKRLLAEGASTSEIEAAVADLGTTIKESLAIVNPDPNFPPPPAPEG